MEKNIHLYASFPMQQDVQVIRVWRAANPQDFIQLKQLVQFVLPILMRMYGVVVVFIGDVQVI